MGDTSIEWTRGADGTQGKTWNPLRAKNLETGGVGHYCEKVSPGCAHCYAERMQPRFKNRIRYNAADYDKVELFLDEETLQEPLHWQKPRNVFVCSMTDLFADFVMVEDLRRIFAVMMCSPWHTFQILTKRPERMAAFFKENTPNDCYVEEVTENRPVNAFSLLTASLRTKDRLDKLPTAWPLPNVWLGVSVENQEWADDRREDFEPIPAAVKFVSYEPALARVDWSGWEFVDQIISGGESGPDARPSHPDWHRETRDFCRANGIAYFFKQWGRYRECTAGEVETCLYDIAIDGREECGYYCDETVGHVDHNTAFMRSVGKKDAGRLLDGVEHSEFPARGRRLTD